eukprot:2162600-Pyramimonas_sp.AAC.1
MFFNELGSAQVPGWTEASNYGRLTAEAALGTSVRTVSKFPVRGPDAAAAAALEFAQDGCQVIIGAHITHRCGTGARAEGGQMCQPPPGCHSCTL